MADLTPEQLAAKYGATVKPVDSDMQAFASRYGATVAHTVPGMEKLGGTPPPAPTGVGKLPASQLPEELKPEDQQEDSFWTSPHGLIRSGLTRAVHGVESGAEPGIDPKLGAASEIIRGVGTAALPAAIPIAMANPAGAVGAIAGGAIGSGLSGWAGRKIGLAPGAQALTEDAGNIAGGMASSPLAKGIGAIVRSPAKPLVNAAIHIPANARSFDADPAGFVLRSTEGYSPNAIKTSGQERINTLMPQIDAITARSTTPIDLVPNRQMIADEEALAARQGNQAIHTQLQPMKAALEGNRVTGTAYPPTISPGEALDLKRGFGDEFATYNPNVHDRVNAIAKNVRGNLNGQLNIAVPEAAEMNQEVHSGIPAVRAAGNTDRMASFGQRIINRISRPTGGMLPAFIGGHVAGPAGAIAGIPLSEAMASPEPLMMAARGLYGAGKGPILANPLRTPEIPIGQRTLFPLAQASQRKEEQ